MLKRFINLTISLGFAAKDSLFDNLRGFFGRRRKGTCVVLSYHSVTASQRIQFARQMDALVRQAKPIPANIMMPPDADGRYAAITFDDGLQSVIENAIPELKKRGIPTTLFIVTKALGGPPSWQHFESANRDSQDVVISEKQLQQLPSELVAIGSHSVSHLKLTQLADDQLRQEILESRIQLERILNQEIKMFSFPYGDFNEKVLRQCRDAGYDRVFTALPVLAFSTPSEFVTGRVRVEPTDWSIEFRLKLAGAYRWLPSAYKWKRKVKSVLRLRPKQNPEVGTGGELAA